MACNVKTTKLLDCALIGVFAVIGLNTVYTEATVSKMEIIYLRKYYFAMSLALSVRQGDSGCLGSKILGTANQSIQSSHDNCGWVIKLPGSKHIKLKQIK